MERYPGIRAERVEALSEARPGLPAEAAGRDAATPSIEAASSDELGDYG